GRGDGGCHDLQLRLEQRPDLPRHAPQGMAVAAGLAQLHDRLQRRRSRQCRDRGVHLPPRLHVGTRCARRHRRRGGVELRHHHGVHVAQAENRLNARRATWATHDGRLSKGHLSSVSSAAAGAKPSWRAAANPLWAVLAMTALAVVVRASGLSGDFYADEVWIIDSARSSHDKFLQEVTDDWVHPPLFFFLMRGLDALFGIDALSGRLVAAVSGVLSVPVIFWLGMLVHSARAGIVAAALLALSPIHVWHSQYGRHYSLLVLLVLLSTASFVKLWREPRAVVWSVLYSLTTVALVYTHYFGWLVVLFQGVTVLLFRFVTLKHWFVIQLALVLAYVPWLTAALPMALAGSAGEDLIPQIGWMEATNFLDPLRTIAEFNGPLATMEGKLVSLVLLSAI